MENSTNLDKIKLSKEIVYKGCQDNDCDRVWTDNLDFIGQEGTSEDIAFLRDLYKKYIPKIDYESLFVKAEIKDAIDKILIRTEI